MTRVSLLRARPDQRETVRRLLEFNAYDFTHFDDRPIGDDAEYGYAYLDAYWSEEGRVAYLIRVDAELAGLALLRTVDGVHSIAEFLVLPKFRRSGVGREAAHRLFSLHPGRWQVQQIAANSAATGFWRAVVPARYAENVGEQWVVQTFTT